MDMVLPLGSLYFTDVNPVYLCVKECVPDNPYTSSTHDYYLLCLLLRGQGNFSRNETSCTVKKGQGVLFSPGDSCSFCTISNEPFQSACIGFTGVRADQFIGLLDLNGSGMTFDYPYTEELIRYFAQAEKSPGGADFFALSFLYRFFAHMSSRQPLSKDLYVSRAMEHIDRNINRQIRVSAIADELGITRAYLYKAFEEVTHQSPKEYMMNRKMQLAYDMIQTERESIASVGRAVGYDDLFAFSKAFKSKYGLSPREVFSGRIPHVPVLDDDAGEYVWPAQPTDERTCGSARALMAHPYLNEQNQCIEGWLLRAGYIETPPLPRTLDISLLTENGKRGALCFDVFVEDQCDITDWCIHSKDWIRFGSSPDWDTDFQYWIGWHEQIKKEGWNKIRLPFGDSQWGHICGKPDYKRFCSFGVMLSVPPNIRVFFDNIRVVP